MTQPPTEQETTRPWYPRHDQPITLRSMPRWYRTIFVADALERFGFYGMQAILVLYAAAPREAGGLGLAAADAASLFGAWIAAMFMLSLAGGWIGDRLLGHRPALQAGCALMTLGYLGLGIPQGWVTAVALCVLAVGGGLFKPNLQALYNLMYTGSTGRESGISLMYVAAQISALLAPLAAGYLGERVSWPLAFAVAALAALLAALRLRVAWRQFGDTGAVAARPLAPAERRLVLRRTGTALAALAALLVGMALGGVLDPTVAIALVGGCTVIVPVFGYLLVYRDPGLNAADRRRLRAFLAVLLGSTLFWMIIAHAASLLNLFARDHVDRDVLGFRIPASWMQSATPTFILVLAPVLAWLLPRVGTRNNVPVKFAIGLCLAGGSFLAMCLAAFLAADGTLVSPLWLFLVYFGHACGEVIIAAVSIAAVAELLPAQFLGRMMGTYWLFAALGGGLGAGVVRLAEVFPEPVYYLGLGTVATVTGLGFLAARSRLTRALNATSSAGS
ncbi:peptide MFS transporter [Amycolatopsis aidingensis]|uniref:peptide MFS transporter n=1 Tax=Amycolatopsis aidingensis TaxID=2842453 RepID=UPI001C0B8F1E|nr:oligopeptide:H+ symporter [Amycolatopsis aidingensis]